MAMFGPLRDGIFKYRKRKNLSLDGSVPDIPYTSYRRGARPPLGTSPARAFGYQHDLYMHGNPGEYRPNLNAPAVQAEEYLENEDWESHMISHPASPKIFRPFPELPAVEKALTYEKSQAASEFFLKLMEIQYTPFEDSNEIPTSVDVWRELNNIYGDDISGIETSSKQEESTLETIIGRFRDVSDALNRLRCVLPEDHPDIVNLSQAQIQLGRQLSFEMEQDPKFWEIYNSIDDNWQSKLGEGNPYENDDIIPGINEPFNNPQEQFFDISAFEQNGHSEPGAIEQEAAFADDFTASGLEQIVEGEQADYNPDLAVADDSLMPMAEMEVPFEQNAGFQESSALNEIEQAIDQLKEDDLLQNPFQQLYDPFMAQQYMFDQQYRPDYMMPGFGPMGSMMGPPM